MENLVERLTRHACRWRRNRAVGVAVCARAGAGYGRGRWSGCAGCAGMAAPARARACRHRRRSRWGGAHGHHGLIFAIVAAGTPARETQEPLHTAGGHDLLGRGTPTPGNATSCDWMAVFRSTGPVGFSAAALRERECAGAAASAGAGAAPTVTNGVIFAIVAPLRRRAPDQRPPRRADQR